MQIVVVENITLHRDAGEGPLEATASALRELTVPLIGSTLTPIVVFLPLITITGVTGAFFGALAIAMSVSLLTSLVLALVWTSNLGTRLIRRGKTAVAHVDAANRDGASQVGHAFLIRKYHPVAYVGFRESPASRDRLQGLRQALTEAERERETAARRARQAVELLAAARQKAEAAQEALDALGRALKILPRSQTAGLAC